MTASASIPRFITFEGIDGAGKSTHIRQLAGRLRAQGLPLTLTREPGGSPLAEKLRALLLQEPMDALSELLLMFAARRDHILHVIAPALARGELVLCDRFSDASFAYQGAGRGFDVSVIAALERWAQTLPGADDNAMLQPDVTFWFDVPPEVAASRLRADPRTADKFEAQPQDFFARVAAGYAARAAAHPERFVRIDAAQPPQQVWEQVLQALRIRGLYVGDQE